MTLKMAREIGADRETYAARIQQRIRVQVHCALLSLVRSDVLLNKPVHDAQAGNLLTAQILDILLVQHFVLVFALLLVERRGGTAGLFEMVIRAKGAVKQQGRLAVAIRWNEKPIECSICRELAEESERLHRVLRTKYYRTGNDPLS